MSTSIVCKTPKTYTLEQYKQDFGGRGESVMEMAYAAQFLLDDKELSDAGTDAIAAEDKFCQLLAEREIERG